MIWYLKKRKKFNMNSIICGGGGFIGYNLAKKILEKGNKVFILDNFSNSKKETINSLKKFGNIEIFSCELSNFIEIKVLFNSLRNEIHNEAEIWHLAANSDIESGVNDIEIDYRDTFLSTYNLLKIAKEFQIKSFFFASSSAVYGNHGDKLVNEDTGPLMPISNYGAMKLASEALCFASYESFLEKLIIFRFPNVVGSPATHGVIKDLITKLWTSPDLLKVLGNGTQAKSYLHVDDLVIGMMHLAYQNHEKPKNPIFNLGNNNDSVTVKWIAEEIIKSVSPKAKIEYGEGDKGWVGDVPKFKYDTEKAKIAGWIPKLNSQESVKKAIKEIKIQIVDC